MKKTPRLLFILPNLFTVSSIFCGLYAILQAAGTTEEQRFFRAAVAILFAVVFDAADGRVARLTRTQSEFGVQLDSLADVISFGVAPAVLVYSWALEPLGLVGLAIAATFATCGALRLARFNVLAGKTMGASKYFTGLPIPMAAATMISSVLFQIKLGPTRPIAPALVVVLVLVLALLMVSNVRFRTFKKLRASRRSALLLILLAGTVGVAAWKAGFSLAFAGVCILYTLLGIAEEGLLLLRRITNKGDEEPEEARESR